MFHTLTAERPNLHGHFSCDLAPVLTIDPGDSVHFQCLDAEWGLEPHNGIDRNRCEVKGRDPVLDNGHALTGPVAIRGANPGMTLEVKINEIRVEGALFSVGDGHAVQGDGELSVTAIECPMDRVGLTFNLRDDFPLDAPIALTPAGWVTLGFNHDLDEAVVTALESMLTLMKRLYGLERLDALALASLVVDMRVTQMVNQVRGAHAVLRPDAIGLPR
jgi:acetamidase/formamidase